jgi:hypothetical protein
MFDQTGQRLDLPWEGQEDPWGFARKGLMRRTGQAGKYAPVLREMVAKFEGEQVLEGPVHYQLAQYDGRNVYLTEKKNG